MMDTIFVMICLVLLGGLLVYLALVILFSPTFWAILGAVAVLVAVDYYGGLGVIPAAKSAYLIETANEECASMDNRYANWSRRDCVRDLVDAWQ